MADSGPSQLGLFSTRVGEPSLRKLLKGVAALTSAAFAASCTVGPDFIPPQPPPVADYGPADRPVGRPFVMGADIPAGWWELFQSPHLSFLVEQGIEHNAELQSAEAAVRVAQFNALAQRGALFPQIAANYNATRQKIPQATLDSPVATKESMFSLFTAQVTVNYVVDVFGANRRQLENMEALAEMQAFQREAVYLTLTGNIALAAIQEASLRGQIAAARRLIGLQTQLLNILQQQNRLGQIALPDVLAQETALAQARLLLPPLEKQLDQQRHLLASLPGRFPSEAPAAEFNLRSLRLPRALPVSLPADLVRQRPDVRAAEANVHASSALVGVAVANRLPQITINGNAGSTALAMSKLFSPGTNQWLIAANVVQSVFDGGTLRFKQKAAEEGLAQSVAQYRSVVLTAFQNVADALSAIDTDTRAVRAAIAAERAASRSIELVRSQLERGQISLPLLMGAQQASLQTSLARIQAQALRLSDVVALFQALGGGWWNRWEVRVEYVDSCEHQGSVAGAW